MMKKQKKILRRLKNEKKWVDKEGFIRYFGYETSALVIKFLNQNTQDFKKSLDKSKQQKIELNRDERNSTNNQNKNDSLNMILSLIDRIYKL